MQRIDLCDCDYGAAPAFRGKKPKHLMMAHRFGCLLSSYAQYQNSESFYSHKYCVFSYRKEFSREKILNTILSTVLALSMILGLPSIAFAAESNANSHSDSGFEYQQEEISAAEQAQLTYAQLTFENMSIEELNRYIDTTIDCINQRSFGTEIASAAGQRVLPGVPTVIELKLLWLAAAQAAKLAGYPCSGKLIECSVLGLNYNESKGAGGLFRDKIVGTSTYKNYINKIKKGTYSTGVGYVLTHPKSENADLYYSLHSCTYTTTKTGSIYKVAVYDLYDFALMNYDGLFTGIVNNRAWLCQHTGVLHKIHVNISFAA